MCSSIVFRDGALLCDNPYCFHKQSFTLFCYPANAAVSPRCSPQGTSFRETAAFAGYYFAYPHTISFIKYKLQRAPTERGRPLGRQESPSQAHIGVLNRPHHGFGSHLDG